MRKKKYEYTKESEVIFNEGLMNVKNDLDIVTLLKTIQKLKAGIAALIKDDDQII